MNIHIFSTSFSPSSSSLYLPPVPRSQTLFFLRMADMPDAKLLWIYWKHWEFWPHLMPLYPQAPSFTQNWPRKILLRPCRLIFFNHYITAKDVRECARARVCEGEREKKEWIKACSVFRILSVQVNVPSWLLFQVCWGHAGLAAPSHRFRARTPRSSSEARHSAQ